jgi:peptide-methionine (S)-S-oxide reductase
MATAIFAAGCFWGVEEAFRIVPGVLSTEVGYTGGHTKYPSYEDVCTGTTGHAEAVRVTFDPTVISYEQLLDVFWECHDPTQVNRQGPDVGDQYRSAIFPVDDAQRLLAEASKLARDNSGNYKRSIATDITVAGEFWRAEEYHQKYAMKNGGGACHLR